MTSWDEHGNQLCAECGCRVYVRSTCHDCGAVTCGSCGRTVTVHTARGGEFWQCNGCEFGGAA